VIAGQRQRDRGGDVTGVHPAEQEGTGADRDPRPAGPQPAQHEVEAALVVVLAVHRRQPEHGAAVRQVALLDLEVLVVGPVDVPLLTQRRGLGQRHRVAGPALVQRLVGAVDVAAGDRDQPLIGAERGQRSVGGHGVHPGHVHDGVGP